MPKHGSRRKRREPVLLFKFVEVLARRHGIGTDFAWWLAQLGLHHALGKCDMSDEELDRADARCRRILSSFRRPALSVEECAVFQELFGRTMIQRIKCDVRQSKKCFTRTGRTVSGFRNAAGNVYPVSALENFEYPDGRLRIVAALIGGRLMCRPCGLERRERRFVTPHPFGEDIPGPPVCPSAWRSHPRFKV